MNSLGELLYLCCLLLCMKSSRKFNKNLLDFSVQYSFLVDLKFFFLNKFKGSRWFLPCLKFPLRVRRALLELLWSCIPLFTYIVGVGFWRIILFLSAFFQCEDISHFTLRVRFLHSTILKFWRFYTRVWIILLPTFAYCWSLT